MLALAIHGPLNIGAVHPVDKVLRKDHRIGPIALSLFPRLAGCVLIERFDNDSQVGAGLGVIEAHEDISRVHPIGVPYSQFPDNPTGRMLHLLDAGIDHQLSGRNHGTRDFGFCCPTGKTNDQDYRGRANR